MKILLINGSPRKNGNTALALREMQAVFEREGFECKTLSVGGEPIRGCIACGGCNKTGRCVLDGAVAEAAAEFESADALIVGSPVYYASANGTLISLLDRLFRSTSFDKTMKVGASVAVARRGGCSATFDQINKYFTISGMPVASSTYWNSVHGGAPGEAEKDEEGLQTLRNLARNVAFLVRSISLGKEKFGLPEKETSARTNFIR